MKLDNIMVGYPSAMRDNKDLLHKIKIIDFGLAMKYMDEKGQHIPETK